MSDDAIANRLEAVRGRIVAAAQRAGRDPAGVTLVGVGKTHPAAALATAVRAGLTHLGENRVQEAAAKKAQVPPTCWHLIGPLQRNKAGLALELFDTIETIDRAALAERLQLLLERDWPGRVFPILLEVNIGEEPQKAGVLPGDTAELTRTVATCDRLALEGLMAIPPLAEDPEASRPHFRALARLAAKLRDDLGHALPALSMGMSGDFDVAVEEGATHVRVGTAIFGSRTRSA